MSILQILGWAGLVLLILTWLGNLRNLLTRGADPRYRLGPDRYPAARPRTLVSVIVPARNEERNIAECLARLTAQDHEPLEILVVDDRSTDRTGEILARLADADPRIRVVPGEEPPPGWMGKVAACWRGQQEARGELLLFVDADVRLEPAAVRQAVAYLEDTGVDGVTLIGRLVTRSFWEHAVQPVIGSLVLIGNPAEKVNDPAFPEAAMANGQFILVRREAYDAVGGHAALKAEVLDDVAFARLMKARQRRLHLLHGLSLMSVRMYAGLREIWEGWTKNFFVSLHRSVGLTAVIWMMVFLTGLLPFLLPLIWPAVGLMQGGPADALLGQPAWWASLGLAGLVLFTYGLGLHRTGHRTRDFWTYPLGVTVLLGILVNSAWRATRRLAITWKGRSYTEIGTGHPERQPHPSLAAPAAPAVVSPGPEDVAGPREPAGKTG